jgi:hypothetical protein
MAIMWGRTSGLVRVESKAHSAIGRLTCIGFTSPWCLRHVLAVGKSPYYLFWQYFDRVQLPSEAQLTNVR